MPSHKLGFHEQLTNGEVVQSIKQLSNRSGYVQGLLSGVDQPAWYTISSVCSIFDDVDGLALPYCWYFNRCYAYARGSGRYVFRALSAQVFHQVLLPSTTGASGDFIAERGDLSVLRPYYDTRSRVRVSQNTLKAIDVGVTSTSAKLSSRAFLSSGDDWQVGMFLGATPLYYTNPADQSLIFNIDSSTLLDPVTTDNRTVLVNQTLPVSSRLMVNDAYGIPNYVTTDTQDGFTVLHTGTSSWSGSAWDRVAGSSSLNVNVPGTVTISDYSKVIVCGVDSSTTPQVYAALPNEEGAYGLPAQLFAPEIGTGDPRNIVAVGSQLAVAPPV